VKLLRTLLILAALTAAQLPAYAARPESDLPTTDAGITATVTPEEEYRDDHQLLVMLRLPATHYRPDATYGGRYIDDNSRNARQRRAEDLARQHGLTLVEGWPMPVLGIDCYVMRYSDSVNADQLIAQLTRDPQVEWAQPVARFEGMAQAPSTSPTAGAATDVAADLAGDPLYRVQPAARYWHVADLHRYTRGRDVKIAVVDSGIDASHPDLQGQLTLNDNFVDTGPTPPENHGTAVAGIIAARAGSGGILGIAPQAKVMGLRACWQQRDLATRCNSFTLSKAINFAIQNNAQIINLSLSGPPDRLLDRLLDVALERGISVVGAIDPHATGAAFPASHRGVLAVASQPRTDAPPASNNIVRTNSDSSSAQPPLLAPGNDIPTTAPGGRWAFVNGSSYAAAHVTGMLALLDELRPGTPPAQMRTLLQSGAALHTATIDACTAISRLVRDLSCARTLSQRGAAP
jgi:subtilisin family serine protease